MFRCYFFIRNTVCEPAANSKSGNFYSSSAAAGFGQSLNIISTVSLTGSILLTWFKNGSLITSPLAAGPVLSNLTVDDIGTYRLVYTDPNGCVGTSADVVITGLASENLWIYPVPNNGTFQVRFFNTANENATLRVLDEKGSKVYERSVVKVWPIPASMWYFLRLSLMVLTSLSWLIQPASV